MQKKFRNLFSYIKVINHKCKNTKFILKEKTLNALKYNVNIELGSTTLTMDEINMLRKGDVITLDSHINDLLTIQIENKAKLFGQPCIYKNKLACQIVNKEDVVNTPYGNIL